MKNMNFAHVMHNFILFLFFLQTDRHAFFPLRTASIFFFNSSPETFIKPNEKGKAILTN